jgi:hypothetical protein
MAQGQAAPAAASISIQGLGHATVPLDGLWQFHEGDDLAWASPDLDDSSWQPIEAGRTWEEQGHPGLTGYGWYRRHIEIAPDTPQDLNLAFYLPAVDSACEVYWNGVRIGGLGKLPPNPEWFLTFTQLPGVFPLGPARSGVLAIRVWKAPITFLNAPFEGGLVRIPRVGSTVAAETMATAAHYRWLKSVQLTMAVDLLAAVVGLLSLLSWLRDRSRWMLLWLAIPMLSQLAEFVAFNIPGFSTFRLGYGLIGTFVLVTNAATWFLLLYLLDLRGNARLVRWTRILATVAILVSLIDGVMVCFDWTRLFPNAFLTIDVVTTVPLEVVELFGLVIIVAGMRKHQDVARWMLAIAVVLAELDQAASDITGLGMRWTQWSVRPEFVSPALFSMAGIHVNAGNLISVFLLASLLYAAWRYSIEQNHRQSAMEQEFRSAQELQQVIIPQTLPEIAGYSIASAYQPAREVGGDFFQILPLEDGSTIIVLGDVSGKGLRAAMAVAMIVGALRTLIHVDPRPSAILEGLNRDMQGRLQDSFATCLAIRLYDSGQATLANAGQIAPYRNGVEVHSEPGLPIGIVPGVTYAETSFEVNPGDQLTLISDGVVEATSPTGELFGFERTAALSVESADQILQTAKLFGQEDDISVLTLNRNAALP